MRGHPNSSTDCLLAENSRHKSLVEVPAVTCRSSRLNTNGLWTIVVAMVQRQRNLFVITYKHCLSSLRATPFSMINTSTSAATRIGALGRSRTSNIPRRRRKLYPVELQGRLELVRMEGLEPPTCGVEARRSVRLSYIRIVRCFALLRVSAESDPDRTIRFPSICI
jgi:hypothetical protein